MPLAIGTRLGSFEIRAPLGEGGMGEVYRALDSRLGREVALKVLPREVATDNARLLRFAAEARSASALNHPNIVTIYEVGQEEALPYIAMELVEGVTLRNLLGGGPLPVKKSLAIAAQLADGLAKAHAEGIVHRDLKPENVMVTRDGYVKVLDFGLAKLVGGSASALGIPQSLTGTGLVVGTAEYMSPEQASGAEVDFRSDQFALGLICYEMLTGRRAFMRGTVVQTLSAIIQDEPEPIEKLNPRAPAPYAWVVERCLSKDPEERYASTQDLSRELRMLRDRLAGVASEPVESRASEVAAVRTRSEKRQATRVQRAAEAQKRGLGQRALAIAAQALVGLLLVAGGFYGGFWFHGQQMDAPPPQWTSELLVGGSTRVFAPLVSPDGQTLAFLTLVDGVVQVAVMKPGAGDWVVLTKDRARGSVNSMTWSRDGSRIFYDRVTDVPNGVYAIGALGGEERPVLDAAQGPECLPDGTLLVVRVDATRSFQLQRYWPETAKLAPVGPLIARESAGLPLRAFPDGREALFYGRLVEREGKAGFRHLYALDLASGQARRFSPELVLNPPFTISPEGRSVVADIVSGDDHRLVEISRAGEAVRTLMTLTTKPWYVSHAPDGSLYVALNQSTLEMLRFSAAGGVPERLALSSRNYFMHPVQLPDGRVLLPSFISGRKRLLVGKPGESLRPFVETSEQSAPPVALVGGTHVAFLGGGTRTQLPLLTLATVADGRVARRFERTQGMAPLALSATPDGRRLYVVEAGTLSELSAESGELKRLRPGDGVAVDPGSSDLIAQVNEKDGVRLVRVPASGGADQPIPIVGDMHVSPSPIAGNAVARDGRIVISVSSTDNWFAGPAVLDPATGALVRVPVQFEGDILPSAWGGDGSILGMGTALKSELWRFRPQKPNGPG